METAVSWKEKGNKFVQETQYSEALNYYSKAIELDLNDPILYSNRSEMYYNIIILAKQYHIFRWY